MGLPLEFTAVTTVKKLSGSKSVLTAFTIPPLNKGEVINFCITVAKLNPTLGGSALLPTPATGVSVLVSLGDSLTEITLNSVVLTPNPLTNEHVGLLPLNVAAILALTPPASKELEIQITQSGDPTPILIPVTIYGRINTPVSVPANPVDVPLGKAEARNLYVDRSGTDSVIWTDQVTGQKWLETVSNGVKQMNLIP
jgi:hypothetical protein